MRRGERDEGAARTRGAEHAYELASVALRRPSKLAGMVEQEKLETVTGLRETAKGRDESLSDVLEGVLATARGSDGA